MRNSLKLGLALALTAPSIFAGCSSGSDDVTGSAGSPSAGRAGAAAGASAAGANNGGGGSSAGGASAGSGGAKAGAGGASAGSGGASAGAGAGGSTAGAGGAAAGAGGAATCADESTGLPVGGAGGATATTTAVVLIDNVVVKKAATTVTQWQFADATTILDAAAGDTPTADKWSRSNYGYTVSGSASASDKFIACAGNPAAGSLKNIAPFTAADQQYEIRVPFAAADYSGAVITANLKLVGGGRPDAACPVKAWIYVVNNEGGTNSVANPIPLEVGKWAAASLTLPATGFDKVGLLGVRLTTFSCL